MIDYSTYIDLRDKGPGVIAHWSENFIVMCGNSVTNFTQCRVRQPRITNKLYGITISLDKKTPNRDN
jgi:hypothetical protein